MPVLLFPMSQYHAWFTGCLATVCSPYATLTLCELCVNSLGAAHDIRLHVVSKEVESTIEYVCKVGACTETHNQVEVRKQLKRQRFSNKNYTGFKMSSATEIVTLLLYVCPCITGTP